jgi:hypothetical protein
MSQRETYLGDGLFASWDGIQIRLRAPRDGGDHVVFLEDGPDARGIPRVSGHSADTTRQTMMTDDQIEVEPCPYVYAKGRKCKGHIVRIEAFKADLAWHRADDGKWSLAVGEPRSHYHLYCSEMGNHAGYGRPDSEAMKLYYQNLPPTLQKAITGAPLA